LKHLSTGEPTDWQSDCNKLQDLADFLDMKGIPQDFTVAISCFDLSSDHSPILFDVLNQEKEPILSYGHKNLDDCRRLVNMRSTLKISLKTEEDIEAAAKFFNDVFQCADWNATVERKRHSRHTTAYTN
jgi:hypothetical protein